MLFLLRESPQKIKLEKVHGALVILFYVSPSSSPLQSCFKEKAKMFPKTPPLKKILQFQEKICIFIKNAKKSLFSK